MSSSSGDAAERSPAVMVVETHEEVLRHLEEGQSRIRALSLITVAVTFTLAASYFSQILLPFVETGQRYQTVDLLNPGLVALEVVVLALTVAWLYVGVVNYLFSTKLGKQVKEIREAEKALLKRVMG